MTGAIFFALLSAPERCCSLLLVPLTAVSGVVIDLSTLVKSTAGKDTGSSVSPMKCKACAAQLGVSYRTTPRSLDGLRDKFSFNTDAISSYEIGKPEIEMEGEDGEATADKGQHEPSNGDEGKQENGRETASLALRVDAFEEQMLKVENMLLLYNERFDQLEKWVAQAGPPGKRQRKLV